MFLLDLAKKSLKVDKNECESYIVIHNKFGYIVCTIIYIFNQVFL